MRLRRSKTDDDYTRASLRARDLLIRLGNATDPLDRKENYDELGRAYFIMSLEPAAGHVPGGYDGDFTADLRAVSSLCWALGISEYALARPPGDRPDAPLDHIPGAAGNPMLAAAWELFWETSDRDQRAALIRGHHGQPARRGEQRQPGGIIPLTSLYAGSAVTGFLEYVADAEQHLATRLAAPEAAR